MTHEELSKKLGVQSPEESIRWINQLYYGEPGVGKTELAGTCLDHVELRPVLYLDVDGGITTVRKRKELEVIQVRSSDQVRAIGNDLYTAVDWEAKDPSLPYKTIVIDTVSELAKLDMRMVAGAAHEKNPNQDKYVPSQREYLINGERMREVVRHYRDLPCNVLFLSHSGDAKDNTNATIFFPQFTGRLRHEIAGFIDIVGYMTATVDSKGGFTNSIQTVRSKRVVAKDRTKMLPKLLENPTMPLIWDIVHGNVTVDEATSDDE